MTWLPDSVAAAGRGALPLLALGATLATPASAQPFRYGLDFGLAAMSAYPSQLETACEDGIGIAPSARVYYRPHPWIGGELSAAAHFTTALENCSIVGIERPLLPGESMTLHEYHATRRWVSAAGEARVVVTPWDSDLSSIRLIGGAVSYPGQGTEGVLAGLGMLVWNRWGAVAVDLERWRVGSRYREIRRTHVVDHGIVEERLGSGRSWDMLWHVRVGALVRVR